MDIQCSEDEQRAFFEGVMERTHQALNSALAIEHFVNVAGSSVRLVFAGPRMEQKFMPALAHLAGGAVLAPDATLYVWDSDSTATSMISPPCDHTCFTHRGDIRGFSSRTVRSAFNWSEYAVSLLDTAAGVGIYWVDSSENLPYWVKSSPLRSLFHWLMEQRGLQLIHAAAIGTERGGVLLTGKGGLGKSTTALAGLASGMSFAGDDYVVVALEPEPTAHSLYCTAKVSPNQLRAFPELASLVRGAAAQDEKAVIYLHPDLRERFARALPLRFVLTPRFGTTAATEFEPISPVQLHQAAAFTTMSQLPHAGMRTHDFIGKLVQEVPGGRILLGRDLQAIPVAISRLLEQGIGTQRTPHVIRPLISVILPVYNGSRFLPEAIANILAQDYPALEIIVVDDGSTDDIERAVAALPVDVRLIRQPNGGPAAARNRGLREASAELIAFLDVDDLWPEGNLISMVDTIEAEPQLDVLIGRAQVARIDESGTGTLEYVGNPEESFPHYIGSALYRRRAFLAVGPFDEMLRFGEDIDWFTRLDESGRALKRLDRISLIVRRHEANMTRGKSLVELHVVRALKKALDRRRAREA